MADRKRITEQEPRTGALPAEQTAQNAESQIGQQPQRGGMTESDRQIWNLVENNVEYAGDQFGENLRFSSEKLTNVLYDNLHALLSDKFNDDGFAQLMADELLAQGAVIRQVDGKSTPEKSITPDEMGQLVAKVDAAIELLKANKPSLLKALNEAASPSMDGGQQKGLDQQALDNKRRMVDGLLKRISRSQQVVQTHIQTQSQNKIAMDSHLASMQKGMNLGMSAFQRNLGRTQKSLGIIQGNLAKIGGNAAIGGRKKLTSPLGSAIGKKTPAKIQGKTSIGRTKIPGLGMSMVNKAKDTKVGKTVSGIITAIVKTLSFTKKLLVKTVTMVVKMVKFAFKVAKTAVRLFVKASRLTGKAIVGTVRLGVAAIKGIGSAFKMTIGNFKSGGGYTWSLAAPLTRLGFKIIKFGARMLWKGVKNLAFKAAQFFKRMFRLGGKFVNKLANWISQMTGYVKDKAYRWLIKPIASTITSMFTFFTGMLNAPVKFMEQIVPDVIDRIRDTMHSIKESAKSVLRSTYGILRRIFTNPVTLVLIVGGAFLLFHGKFFGWIGSMVDTLRNSVIPFLATVANTVVRIVKPIWDVLKWMIPPIFKFIMWLTDPDGWIWKAVTLIVESVMTVKKWIRDVIKASGKDSIDVACMFLAGDTISIAIGLISGIVMKVWNWAKDKGFIRMAFAMVRSLVKIGEMIWNIPSTLLESLKGGGWALAKWITTLGRSGSAGDIAEKFAEPWKKWWEGITSIFKEKKTDIPPIPPAEYLNTNPVDEASKIAGKTKIAVRSLGTIGKQKSVLAKLDSLGSGKVAGDLLTRIRNMNRLYQANAQQVTEYEQFLTKTWEMGAVGQQMRAEVLYSLLDSPALSQRLLSALFYYDPQTGQTMMLRPAAFVGQFLDNIRLLVASNERNGYEAPLREVIDAFDQLNKERGHIVNQQGKIITQFADEISQASQNPDDTKMMDELSKKVVEFNKGNLFKGINHKLAFEQQGRGDAQSQHLDAIAQEFDSEGNKIERKLGSSDLLKVSSMEQHPTAAKFDDKSFVAKPPEEEKDKVGTVTFQEGSTPPVPNFDENVEDGKSMYELWKENQRKRAEMLKDGKLSSKEVADAGYDAYTFDEFRQMYRKKKPLTKEQVQALEDNKAKRFASLRVAQDVMAYNRAGKNVNVEGFKLGKTGTILSVPTDNLNSILYMFSPAWQTMRGASKFTDDQLLDALGEEDAEVKAKIRKQRQEEARKKQEEQRRRQREKEILDYSARVSGGFIEVKIGEDVQAMREAYRTHMDKLRDFLVNHSQEEADAAGLYNFTWDEWKRYYRKMHGLPEDGIRRIPFEGKKKERKVDWSARYALSTDELSKYGIEMSKDGPVMIPLDKAMQAASDLLKGAKTIYSVRDGLEVMRQGLKTETSTLKKRREGGVPVGVVAPSPPSSAPTTTPMPGAGKSEYSQVG